MSKKVLALVLALVMVLGSFSFVSAAPMNDVEGTVYEDAVARLSLLEVLTGYPDGTFKPENTITRAEFAAVAVRAKGLANAAEASKGLPTGFSDVQNWHWASGIVGTAAKTGVVNGIGNGLFAPEAPVKYEEAITMLVRALGYEAAAQTKGGYPYGYLIVANEIGLLDEVKGTQGAPASRGIVAQMTDNALEIPLMIQVGFGSETKWVVSGSREHGTDAKEEFLLDAMGFDSVTGRVTNVNSNRKAIAVTVEDEDEIDRLGKTKVTIDVPAGFDIYEVEGVESKFWYKGDIVISKVLEEAKFDAYEYIAKDDKIKLITEDEKYDIGVEEKTKPAYMITINGEDYDDEDAPTKADYAKVVINSDDEIIWGQAYTFDGFFPVEEVDKEVAYSYDDHDEVDLEDFLIVKDGKEISIDDIEEGDVLYYNDNEEFAVVFNNSKEGEIERIYTSAGEVRFSGKNYTIAGDAIYLDDEGKIELIDSDNLEILEELQDKEEEVTIFFNFKNEVAVVLAEEVTGTSNYYVMTKDANVYSGRGGKMLALDVRNHEGDKLTFDLDEDFVGKDKDYKVQGINDGSITAYFETGDDIATKLNALESDGIDGNNGTELLKGQVLKITLDKDGDPIEVVRMAGHTFETGTTLIGTIKVTNSKVKVNNTDYRLKSNTVIFYDETDEAILLGNAEEEFTEVEVGSTVYVEKGNAVAIVGDVDSDTTTVSALLKSKGDISRIRDGYYEFKVVEYGTTKRYVTEDKYSESEINTLKESLDEDVINITISDKTGKVVKDADTELPDVEDAKAISVTKVTKVSGNTIDDDGTKYSFNSKGKVYYADGFKTASLSDAEKLEVTLYMEGNSNRYVNYVIIGESAPIAGAFELNGSNKITVSGISYDPDDNKFVLRISRDDFEAFSTETTHEDITNTLEFDIEDQVPFNGIYKVELLSVNRDYRVIKAVEKLFLNKNN